MRTSAWIVAVMLMLSACAVAAGSIEKTNKLSIGMTKAEVLEIMGKPDATRATANLEFLTYHERTKPIANYIDCLLDPQQQSCGKEVEFLVRLVNSRVDAYGMAGDFDLTKDPAADINLSIEEK